MTLPPPPTSVLVIEAKRHLPIFIRPWAEINGYPVALRWGSNTINVPPGVHHVRVYVPRLWQTGRAEITVDNRNDPVTTVYYAAPYVTFVPGAIGLSPVKNPGLGLFLTTGGLTLLLCACIGAMFVDRVAAY